MAEITHGKHSTYKHHRCRCDECRAANTAYERKRLERFRPHDAPHGTRKGYAVHGCRCNRCRQAYRLYMKRLRDDVDPSQAKHGTCHGYNFYGCRCDDCTEAHRIQAIRHTAIRHLRKATAERLPYEREDVFARDNWVCQLCYRYVDRDAEVPDPEAPTIDHIVSLAMGGADTPENVQTAHARCNREKGIGREEQMIIPETTHGP